MQRKVKENLPPRPESARKSRVPVPKSTEMTRKRRNNSSPSSGARQPVPKSPRTRKTVTFGSGKNIKEASNPQAPLRSINSRLLNTDYDQEDIEFETDDSALQSILNDTGIQTTPSHGHQSRHTLATVPNQRISIYAPPEKKDINSFRKMCEDFARGRSQSQSRTSLTTGHHQAVQKSTGGLTGVQRRITTDSLFTPKRRCFETSLKQDKAASKENLHTGKVSTLPLQAQSKDIRLHFKGDSLGVLPEEKTEELSQLNIEQSQNGQPTQNKEDQLQSFSARKEKDSFSSSTRNDESVENISGRHNQVKQGLSARNEKLLQSLMTELTPKRIPRSERMSICPATDSIVRYTGRESMPGRVLKEQDVAFQQNPRNCSLNQAAVTRFSLKSSEDLFGDVARTPTRTLKLTDDVALRTPKERRMSEMKSLTPSRVLVQKKLVSDSPKVYNFAATPMRVLKHGHSKPDLQYKGCVQDVVRTSNNEQKLSQELAGNTPVIKQEPEYAETGNITKYEKKMSKTAMGNEEPGSTSPVFRNIAEDAVWTSKTTSAKTPVKQEILTSKIEKSYEGAPVARETRNEHQQETSETATHTQSTPHTHEWTGPTMQLPVVISTVDKSGQESDEMPDSITSHWSKSKTGTLLPQSLNFVETSLEKGQVETTQRKPCEMTSSRQELLDRVQQHLERKLQRLENTRSSSVHQIAPKSDQIIDDHLNIENNNLPAKKQDIFSINLGETAGQCDPNITQGFDNQTNANSHTSVDINCNVGSLAVNSPLSFNETQSNKTLHPSANTNVTFEISEENVVDMEKEMFEESSEVIENIPTLRKTNMNTKVVNPDFESNITDIVTPLSSNKPKRYTDDMIVEDLSDQDLHDVGREPETDKVSNLFAPTPRVMRQADTIEQLADEDIKSAIPLMTPLALKMVAKRKKQDTNMTLDESACSSKSLYKPKFYHHMEDKDQSIATENIEQSAIEQSESFGNYEKFGHSGLRENLEHLESLEYSQREVLHKTPPSTKSSAFSVVKKSSLTPLVGSLSLRGNVSSRGRVQSRAGSREAGLKGMLLSMDERYQEALLDDEVARFAERLVMQQVGHLPRCTDPVAQILLEGDDMHFVPIEEDIVKPSCSGYIPGSAFTKYQTLVG